MRIIAISNQKGGSAKSTTCVCLAAALAEKKRRVLVLDLDAQASASSWLGVKDGGRGLLDLLTDGKQEIAPLIRETAEPNVFLVPSSPWLMGAEKALASEVGAETILRRKLAKIEGFDYVFLDCGPALGVLTVNALAAAKEVLIPVESHVMAVAGLVQLLKTINVVKERLNEDLTITGILTCRLDARTRHSQEVLDSLRKQFGSLVFQTAIRENIRLAESPSFSLPITKYDPRSAGAEDYRALALEVMAQERKNSKHGTAT
jgi:chromosome partitioning protein